MLKLRVIPVLLVKDIGLVKGVSFDSQRRIGSVLPAVTVYNLRDVDELVLLDIMATQSGREPDYRLVEEMASHSCVPFSIGGGISSVDIVGKLLRAGADKVVLNSALYENPILVSQIAGRFGSQCIIASIDVRLSEGEGYVCYTHSGSKRETKELGDWVRELELAGVGEILITSIDRDGTMLGYDCNLISQVAASAGIPVIAAGGAGSYQHMYEAVTAGASAIAAASMFHFTEQTPCEAKRFLREKGIQVRI